MYAFETVNFFKKYVPGFENVRIKQLAPFLGGRYSRSVVSDHPLTDEQAWAGTPSDEVVHRLTHLKKREGGLVDMEHGEEGPEYEMPYRSLLPRGVDGLLAAGRNLGSDTASRRRARWIVLLTGCISGIAAARAVKAGVDLRDLDVKSLQAKLIKDGFDLGGPARLKELGL
jgi:hypothetical protein